MYKTDHIINEILLESGLCPSHKGYDYVVYGLLLIIDQNELLTQITKGLYGKIADHYDVKVSNVERNMRTAIQAAWKRNKEMPFYEGYNICPSNSTFMDLLLHRYEQRIYHILNMRI